MSLTARIEELRSRLPEAMARDRYSVERRLRTLRGGSRRKSNGTLKTVYERLDSLERKVATSASRKSARIARRPRVSFPEELPITSRKDEILEALGTHRVIIVSGDTGSGKSTQLPKMCLEAGRGIDGTIGCTQPRRIAAAAVARRIAEEMGQEVGASVGYKVRFQDRTGRDSYIKIMTDGMLLAETQQDRYLTEYDTLIIDEAHERSLNVDFLLGFIKTLLTVRSDLKVIITSATMDTEKFSAAFDGAPVVRVEGRMYPVDVRYRPVDEASDGRDDVTYLDGAVDAVHELVSTKQRGDMLIFMPTEQDILETCERLEGRGYPGTTVLPLFARLSAAQQAQVFAPVKGRKIVVSTNVAETSLTIPGIRFVIDTGVARISRYVLKSRTTSLPISPISRSSADQRKGRCGRVAHGICIRLYSEKDYETRDAFTPPEILRSNLAEVILRMIALKLGDIATFPFVDTPNPRSIKDGFDMLVELGAVVKRGSRGHLTEMGRLMARMPIDPRIARMLIEGHREGCVEEVSIIAAALSIQDPRERPVEKRGLADQRHAPFRDPASDFITLLNIRNRYDRWWKELKSGTKVRSACKEHFLSFLRMREWQDIHRQLLGILDEQRMTRDKDKARREGASRYEGIHRAILSGFLSNIARRKDTHVYTAARGREPMIFPGSTLFKRPPEWIVAAEMVKTSRLFARTTAKIDPAWLEELGGDLCTRSYSGPHWEKRRGEVRAYEQVSLYGLVIVSGRNVSYGRIDPAESHRIFVRSALIDGEVKTPLPFLVHNRQLIDTIAGYEDKIRRRDLLVCETALEEFYSQHLKGVCDIPSLKKVIRERGGDEFLTMREDDLLLTMPDSEELALFPDRVGIARTEFECSYRFAPGQEHDGVTVTIPSSVASGLDGRQLEWVVPGLLKEKIAALVKGLPKRYRKQLIPVSRTVDVIVSEMPRGEEALVTSLVRFVYRRFGVDIPASAWDTGNLPDYLKMRVSVTDHEGREIDSGRDAEVFARHSAGGESSGLPDGASWKAVRQEWERDGITTWDFDSLPERIPAGPHLFAFPALTPSEDSVSIRLYHSLEEAREVHSKGVMTLCTLRFAKELKFLRRVLTLPATVQVGAAHFGGVDAVRGAVMDSLLETLFRSDIRSRESFESHVEEVAPTIRSQALSLLAAASEVLEAHHQVLIVLHRMESSRAAHGGVKDLCATLRDKMERLVPRDFLLRYAPDRLAHLPRFLKALTIRAERAAYDVGKDREKMERVAPFVEVYRALSEALPAHATEEKKQALERFRWLIEEFEVSVFAQEVKTSEPVSAKRLEKLHREIDRMV